MMTREQVETATREQLADELAAACQATEGWQTMPIDELRAAVREQLADYNTNVQSVRDIIRHFLSLPAEAMPSASYIDCDEPGNAWQDIRDYLTDSSVAPGVEIRLYADRPEWKSVIVSLDTH